MSSEGARGVLSLGQCEVILGMLTRLIESRRKSERERKRESKRVGQRRSREGAERKRRMIFLGVMGLYQTGPK